MNRLFLLLVTAACFTLPGKAQTAPDKRYRFCSLTSIGFPIGQNAGSIAFQSINGLRKGSWAAGLGLGIDYYLYRSAPLFADVRKEFGKGLNKWIVYAEGGLNLPCVPESLTIAGEKYNGGWCSDAGVAYAVKFKKNRAVLFSLGQSFKTLTKNYNYTDWLGIKQTDLYRYHFSRILFKMGWRF